MSKLQELLEELKALKKYYALETYEDSDFGKIAEPGELVMANELEELITKYTETTPTYKEEQAVRVVKNLCPTPFIIGFTVILKEKRAGNLWRCSDGMDRGLLTEEEFEPIN